MVGLSHRRAGAVRALIETAPDGAIHSLELALRNEQAGALRAGVKAIVDAEVHDRATRDAVLEPINPLFVPRLDGFDRLQFPIGVHSRLWRAMKEAHPAETALAAAVPVGSDSYISPSVYDELCRLAAQGLRGGECSFTQVLDLLATEPAISRDDLIACLDVAPIARRAVRQLPCWLARMTAERAATIRLIFKDAVSIDATAGPRLIEILFAHLAEPWTILRVVSALMLNPGDRYASSSELADFGARLLRDVDERVVSIKTFDYNGGAEAGAAAANCLRIAAAVAAEFDLSLSMNRDGPWGERLARQKQALAASVESHLRKIDTVVADALPMQRVGICGHIPRTEPQLDSPPNPAALRRARALLTFLAGIRSTAAQGGCGATRAETAEDVARGLDAFAEKLLAMQHSGEREHLDNARAYLEAIAELTGIVHDEQAAQILRRRAATFWRHRRFPSQVRTPLSLSRLSDPPLAVLDN